MSEITWNDVKNGLPQESMWTLVTTETGFVTEAYYYKKKKEFTMRNDLVVTDAIAWSKMPEPYKPE